MATTGKPKTKKVRFSEIIRERQDDFWEDPVTRKKYKFGVPLFADDPPIRLNDVNIERIRHKIRRLDALGRKMLGGADTTGVEKQAWDGKEDIHDPFVKCPIPKCYFTYHKMREEETLRPHLHIRHKEQMQEYGI